MEALGVNADVFFLIGGPWPATLGCQRARAKPPRATEDSPVGRFKKFPFEKVGTGMYYVHAKTYWT